MTGQMGKRSPARLEQASRIILEEMMHHSRVRKQVEMLEGLIAKGVSRKEAVELVEAKYPIVEWSCNAIREMLLDCGVELYYRQIKWFCKMYLERIGEGKIESMETGRRDKPRYWIVNGWHKEVVEDENKIGVQL